MKLGLWGARMDNSGLGQQTLSFYKHMKPDKTTVMDISVLERTPERVMNQYPERYPDKATFIKGIAGDAEIREFLKDLDVVFVAESAYNNDFYRVAKEMGVKVANQYNYEFFDWLIYPQFMKPDLFIAPSTWHYLDVNNWVHAENTRMGENTKHVYLHCPVDRLEIPFRRIESALTFVHVAGRPAAHDRNGTFTFLEAATMAEQKINAIVYTQDKDLAKTIKKEYPSVKVKENVANYKEIYQRGSVLVLPRRYGGNCLPLNEALSAGMPVIMSDLSPQSDLLPKQWLVKARETDIEFTPRIRIPVYECSPYELSLKMLWFRSLSAQDMRVHNDKANEIADQISWSTMKPKYLAVFEALCNL